MFRKYFSWFGVSRIIIISFNGLFLSVTELANIGIFISYINSFNLDTKVMRFVNIFDNTDAVNFILFFALMVFGAVARILLFNNFRKIVREVTKELFALGVFLEEKGIEKQRSKLVYVNQGVRSFAQICAGFVYCVIGMCVISFIYQAGLEITVFTISLFLLFLYLYVAYSKSAFTHISHSLNDNLEKLSTSTTNEALDASKLATDYQARINMKNQSITIIVQNSVFLCLGTVIFFFGEIGVIDVLGLILMVSRLTPKLLELLRGLNVLASINKVIT
jgi:hypothetical protein